MDLIQFGKWENLSLEFIPNEMQTLLIEEDKTQKDYVSHLVSEFTSKLGILHRKNCQIEADWLQFTKTFPILVKPLDASYLKVFFF